MKEEAPMLEVSETLEIQDILQTEAEIPEFKEMLVVTTIQECTQELAAELNLQDLTTLATEPEVVPLYIKVHQEAVTTVLTGLPALQEAVALLQDQVPLEAQAAQVEVLALQREALAADLQEVVVVEAINKHK